MFGSIYSTSSVLFISLMRLHKNGNIFQYEKTTVLILLGQPTALSTHTVKVCWEYSRVDMLECTMILIKLSRFCCGQYSDGCPLS